MLIRQHQSHRHITISMSLNQEQTSLLQAEVQTELERREWAEPGDLVMAEYIIVLLSNGNPPDRVQKEMEELVGADFNTSFLDWLFARRDEIVTPAVPQRPIEPTAASAAAAITADVPPRTELSERTTSTNEPAAAASSRMFNSAVEGTKRKLEAPGAEQNKRRAQEQPHVAPPTGPRAMNQTSSTASGRALADRLGPRGFPPQAAGLSVRGMANGRGGRGMPGNRGGGPMGNPGFRPPMAGGFPSGAGFVPGQQEMMLQMMAMHASMTQMAEQMAQMQNENPHNATTHQHGYSQDRQFARRPPAPAKVPPGTTLGNHKVSSIKPSGGELGPIPTKPSSTALCKFGVGCSNSRCPYSHPSPVADERTGMVLSEEACEQGKDCKDPECVKSHVSPAVVTGSSAGPSKTLCKFQNCTNPSCQFRHEDANGNLIPPPALSKPHSTTSEIEKPSLDAALDDVKTERPCRYGERCTRADCKFTHPASRSNPNPRAQPVRRTGALARSSDEAIGGGMTPSKKFGAKTETGSSSLNPSAGEFKPSGSVSS